MEYSVQVNAVNKPDKNIKAFATLTFGDCFKITNVAILENKQNVPFIAMPSFRSRERTEQNEAVYKDVCNPITKEFRVELYGKILAVYDEMKQKGRSELAMAPEHLAEPQFSVNVTPYQRQGSNILGLARIYFEDRFVVGNVSILKGKEKEFVAMPSYKIKQMGKDGKPQYQDLCFPVTREFREKLYHSILDSYTKEIELATSREHGMNQEKLQPGGMDQPDRGQPLQDTRGVR